MRTLYRPRSRRRKNPYRKKRRYWYLLTPLIFLLPILMIYLNDDINIQEHYQDYRVVSGALVRYETETKYYHRPDLDENGEYPLLGTDDGTRGYIRPSLRDSFQQAHFEQEVQPGDTITLVINSSVKSWGRPTIMQVEANGVVYLSREDSLRYFERLIGGRKETLLLRTLLLTAVFVLGIDVPILLNDVFPEIFQAIYDWKWRH